MASEKRDEINALYSMLQSLSTSDLEESLKHHICCTQATLAQISDEISKLQEEPAQQANQADQVANLQEKDQQLAEVMEKEMTHWEKVSVLSQMDIQQVEEVKAKSQENWYLSALVEQQQEAIKKLASPKSSTREPRAMTSHSESQLDIMRDEIFNLIPGTVNTRWGAAVALYLPTVTPVVNKDSFEDMLAEEANFTPSHQSRHVKFPDVVEGGLTSTHVTFGKSWHYL